MNIIAMCAVSPGLTAIKFALVMGVKIKKVIGLSDTRNRDKNLISGIIDIGDFCKANNLEFSYVSDYSLKTESPAILGDDVDLIWVCGWQRLLPKSFLNIAKMGVLGAHGSCDGITKGRGRSPLNWALMIGAKKFEVSIFKISDGVDDGDIISSCDFELSDHDTISSSYIKYSILVAKLIGQVYQKPKLLISKQKQKGEIFYFPKRIPDDGVIDWGMCTIDIHNQIRALVDPYPNSFTLIGDKKIFIKKSIPLNMKSSFELGKVAHVFDDNSFLVGCKDGLIHIIDYEKEDKEHSIKVGLKFRSVCINETISKIIKRFKSEFPGKRVNPTLINFWSSNNVDIKNIK